MRTRVTYEWDCEIFDPSSGDIIEHQFGDNLKDIPWPSTAGERLVLVRYVGDDEGVIDKQWAYVDESRMLPAFFSIPCADGNDHETQISIPKRFHREIARVAGGK